MQWGDIRRSRTAALSQGAARRRLSSLPFHLTMPTLWWKTLRYRGEHRPLGGSDSADTMLVRAVNGGTPPPSAPARWGAAWTQVEIDMMLAMIAKRKPQNEVAQALCRTLGAIKIKLSQVRHDRPDSTPSVASPDTAAVAPLRRRPWSRTETEALRVMIAKGWGDMRIAKVLDRTPVAISVRRNRLRIQASKTSGLQKRI